MVKAIHLGRTLEAFLTTITLGLGALLTPRLILLVLASRVCYWLISIKLYTMLFCQELGKCSCGVV